MFTDPLPPSSNRDKIHFSRGELIQTLWPLLILSGRNLGWIQFSFNIIFCKLPKVKDNDAKMYIFKLSATNCVETETQNEHGTWDKKDLTPPSTRICPLFGELRIFITPPPPLYMDQSLIFSNFFWTASLIYRVQKVSCDNSFCIIIRIVFI